MHKNLTITALLGLVTILLGAFGAHSLKETLTVEGLKSFETAVTYQMYHALLLLILGSVKSIPEEEKKLEFLRILNEQKGEELRALQVQWD